MLPLILEKISDNGLYLLNCEICGGFYGMVDDDYVKFYNLDGQRDKDPHRKIDIICSGCRKIEKEGGRLIRNFGPVPYEMLKEKNMLPEQNTAVAKQKRKRIAVLDDLRKNTKWDAIETSIKNQKFKLVEVAKEMGLSANDLKSLLLEQFGDNLEFRRGRNGGVFWKNNNSK